MAISDDLRAVAKFGTPMLNGRSREDFLNAAADEIDRLRTALRAIANAPDHHRGDWYEMVEWMCSHARSAIESKEQSDADG